MSACIFDKIENKVINNRVTIYTVDKVKNNPGKVGMIAGAVIGSAVTTYVVPKIVDGFKYICRWMGSE